MHVPEGGITRAERAVPREAVTAAVAVAREHGLPFSGARVLKANRTTIVALGRCIARVQPPGLGVEHEVAVALHAVARGGPVVSPTRDVDPGPHEHGGLCVSFWEAAPSREPARPEVVGRALRHLHEALADYQGALPPFGHAAEAVSRLARLPDTGDHRLLREALEVPVAEGQALHGDAAQSNCLGDGRWIDFALTGRGPREADVATLVARHHIHHRGPDMQTALAAYGRFDADRVRDHLRRFVALTCVLLLEQPVGNAGLARLLDERLAWLRRTR